MDKVSATGTAPQHRASVRQANTIALGVATIATRVRARVEVNEKKMKKQPLMCQLHCCNI
jgi:hypothetical protein